MDVLHTQTFPVALLHKICIPTHLEMQQSKGSFKTELLVIHTTHANMGSSKSIACTVRVISERFIHIQMTRPRNIRNKNYFMAGRRIPNYTQMMQIQ